MNRILIINDTSSEFHVGCLGVMKTIMDDVFRKWPEATVETITTNEIKRSICVNRLLLGLDVPDHVVVNGEGSMHEKNKEGAFIIDLIKILSEKGVSSFFMLNLSIYDVPVGWLSALQLFSVIQVRDRRSFRVLSDNGLRSDFLPDRLFRFSLECYQSLDLKKVKDVLLFDAVNRSHRDLTSIVDRDSEGGKILYGAVDCSPFLTARVLERPRGALSYGFVPIIRFYLKILRRLIVYSDLPGDKYISTLRHPVVTCNGAAAGIYSARYHIAVMCFSLCLNGKFLSSNTLKIEALIECLADTFPGQMQVQKLDDGLTSVRWEDGSFTLMRNWIGSFKYLW